MSRRDQPTSASSAWELLQPRYFWLTTFVGLVGTGVGLAALMMVAKPIALALGLDWDAPARDQANAWLWLFAFLLTMALALYVGCAVVATTAGAVLVRKGKLTSREVIRYALLFRHPESWFRN